jgi:3-mercaptopyruvate sulfurtransferase SseA
MRFILSLLMISALTLFMACQKASSSSTETKSENPVVTKTTEKSTEKETTEKEADNHEGHDDDVARISLADAKKAFDDDGAIFVDTRSAVAFKNEHIKGAINVPAGEFETTYQSVPKDKKIIAYCS